MPLNLPVLKQDIKKALDKQKNNTGDQDAAIEVLANDLSLAIDKYVRSGLVITGVVTNPGQAVATAGTALAQVGTTIAPGTGAGTGAVT
tara:strand:+ start:217 stop:483 length:267 start_codon:yes stop_codon:yes gene_type:complete